MAFPHAFHESIALTAFLTMFLPVIHSFDATNYLSKYQIQPAVEAIKAPPFRCHNGGNMVRGRADFSMFPHTDNGEPLSFLLEDSRQGYHCACPEGFTGLRCGRPYEFCSSMSSNGYRAGNSSDATLHVCFNHGKCIEGLDAVHSPDQLFCDCSDATFRGKTYSGKYCEFAAPELQTCNRQGSEFCVHGQCKQEDDDTIGCTCNDGYAGEHCNFMESEEPSCDLDCGPGICRITYAHYDGANDTLSYWRHNINHTFCSCPPGHTGTTCEISAEALASGSGSVDICDESMKSFCVNGGVCTPYSSPGSPCSCPVGFDGPHCEFLEGEVPDCNLVCRNGGVCTLGMQSIEEATNYTQFWKQSANNMYCTCPVGRHGAHCELDLTDIQSSRCGEAPNTLFCFNGVCETDLPSNRPTCHCKRGFVGESCQYRQDEVPPCALDCQYGTCVLGVKTLADSNDMSRFWENHVNFTHCRCDEGWYGTNCEIPSMKCGSKTCLGNGTKCAASESGEAYCDCSSVTRSDDPLALAGEHCQYEATSYCLTDTEYYYCYNNGICSTASAGCDCPDGFTGPVCEYEENREPKCSLECQNGGACKKGKKYITNVTNNPELDFLQVFSNDNFEPEHCLCKDGFAGNKCETKVEVCGEDNHVCLHGSKCKKEEDGSHRCDCETAFTPESRWAGKYCQHHHTDVCTPSGDLLFSGSYADTHFCVNDGVCRKRGSPGHPGCDCGPLYFGSRCEFSRLYDSLTPRNDANSSIGIGSWVYIFFLLIFVSLFALIAWRIRMNSRELADSIEESKRWVEESLAPFAPLPRSSEADDVESMPPPKPKVTRPRSRLDSVEIL